MTSTQVPAWRAKLSKALAASMKENKDSISYALSTIDPQTKAPTVRFVLHRGFVNERRDEGDSSSNDIGDSDKGGWTSDCLLSTSDVRAPKVQHLLGEHEQGGAMVELAWWLLPEGQQFRIRGRAYVVPPPSHPLPRSSYPPKHCAPPRDSSINDGKPFDWQQERLRIFEKLSPALKASFGRPRPSQPHNDDPNDWPRELQEGDEQLKDLALSRFALIVIDPAVVDWAYLKDLPNVRERYTRKAGTNDWSKEDIVP